jgi:hypothetical protein
MPPNQAAIRNQSESGKKFSRRLTCRLHCHPDGCPVHGIAPMHHVMKRGVLNRLYAITQNVVRVFGRKLRGFYPPSTKKPGIETVRLGSFPPINEQINIYAGSARRVPSATSDLPGCGGRASGALLSPDLSPALTIGDMWLESQRVSSPFLIGSNISGT